MKSRLRRAADVLVDGVLAVLRAVGAVLEDIDFTDLP